MKTGCTTFILTFYIAFKIILCLLKTYVIFNIYMSGQLSTGIPEGWDDTGSQLLHSVFTHTMLVLGTELRSSVTITNCWAITLPHWCNSSDKNVLCHSKGSDYWLCTQSPKNFHFLHVAFIIKWWYLKIFLYFLSVLYNLHLYSSGFDVHIYSVGKYKFCVHMFMYDWIGLCVCLHMYVFAYVYIWRSEINVKCFVSLLSTLFFEIFSLISLIVIDSTRLAVQKNLESCLSQPPEHWNFSLYVNVSL